MSLWLGHAHNGMLVNKEFHSTVMLKTSKTLNVLHGWFHVKRLILKHEITFNCSSFRFMSYTLYLESNVLVTSASTAVD